MRLPTHRPPIHPGEILLEEFIKPFCMSQTEVARKIGVNPKNIYDIVRGKKGISVDIAIRLSRLFGTSPELWLNGQMAWDIWNAMHGNHTESFKSIEPVMQYQVVSAAGL